MPPTDELAEDIDEGVLSIPPPTTLAFVFNVLKGLLSYEPLALSAALPVMPDVVFS